MMNIPSAHKDLLKSLGLVDEDFTLFDGKWVTYEYDSENGVRLYDPHYRTTYNEYIGIDGWSAWSVEEDSFMSDILKPTREAVKKRRIAPARAETVSEALQKKFGSKADENKT